MASEALPPGVPEAEAIDAALARRVGACGLSPGMVVRLVDGGEHRFHSCGRAAGSGEAVTERTAFEIGSVTKLITALLLCDMARTGDVARDTPVSDLLPAGTRLPERNRVPVTLAHLATHSSGLPRLPDDIGRRSGSPSTRPWGPRSPSNPDRTAVPRG